MKVAYELAPALVVDVKGSYCPVPIVETAKAVKLVEVGEVVLVLATDPGVESDMPAWCKSTGNELLSIERREGSIETRVRRQR